MHNLTMLGEDGGKTNALCQTTGNTINLSADKAFRYTPPTPIKLSEINAYIPNEYASKEDKIQLYQEIENAKTVADLDEIKKRIRDMHGRLPDEVKLLLKKRRLDILLAGIEFDGTIEIGNAIEIKLSQQFSNIEGVGAYLFDAIAPFIDSINISYVQKTLKVKVYKKGNWLLTLETLVDNIRTIYKRFSKRSDKI